MNKMIDEPSTKAEKTEETEATVVKDAPDAPAAEGTREAFGGLLSAGQVAQQLGVSPRTVYVYADSGKLPCLRLGERGTVIFHEEDVRALVRTSVGRVRTRACTWRKPPTTNREYITQIKVRISDGFTEHVEQTLEDIWRENQHTLPGTSARYIARDQVDPMLIHILLIWRQSVMPPASEQKDAVASLIAAFAGALEWSTALIEETVVLLHALT